MKSVDIKSLIRANVLNLKPYSTARDEYNGDLGVYLDANESPYENGFNRYPDPHQIELKKILSELNDIPVESIFAGNGSDEPIDLIFRVFCDPGVDNVVSIIPTYGMYKVGAEINCVELREVKLDAEFELDVDAILSACDSRTKVIMLCSPNNPTGNSLCRKRLLEIAEKFNGIVVVDEAYIDFSDKPSLISELKNYNNILILRTLSKAWGMAGLRLGLALGDKEIICAMSKVKYPYNINTFTQRIVIEQLKCGIEGHVSEIKREREKLINELSKISVVKKIYNSDANFLLVKFDDPDYIYNLLINNGIIVRNRSRIDGCDGCLRITVGLPEENSKILQVLNNMTV